MENKIRPEHPYLRVEYVDAGGVGCPLRVIDQGEQWPIDTYYQGKIIFCSRGVITAWVDEKAVYFANANDIFAMMDEVPVEV